MKIETVKVGMLETNCYILSFNKECLIIDPGDEEPKILDAVGNSKVIGIIITHYHFDHIGALEDIQKITKAKIFDFKNLKSGKNKIGDFEFEVIFTPGHKEDCISIYFEKEKMIFSGDFIFEGTIGRCDLKGGNINEMKKSIVKILKYPTDIIIYPGHGDKTMLEDEKENLEYYAKHF